MGAELRRRLTARWATQGLDNTLPLLFGVSRLFVGHSACRQHLGQTPVHHLHFAERTDHDIGRLEVTMNHAARMRVCHRLTDLLEDADEPATVGGRVLTIRQKFRQRLPLDQLHGDERSLVRELPEFINRSDPRMLQLPADLSFLDKPLDDFRFVLVLIQQHLDRQIAAQIGVAALEDCSHPAASNFALQLIPAVGIPIRHLGRLGPHDRIATVIRRFSQHDVGNINGLPHGFEYAVTGVAHHDRGAGRESGSQPCV
ncbi:MAG: hypothetical protein U0935_25245 [Pirellulales bacterium]